MTKEEVIRIATGLRTDFKCESDTMVDFCNTIIKTFEQEPILDKPHIQGDYMQGYKNGLRTAEWRYNNAIKEIREHADRLKDSLYGDGLRHALDIIDKYKAESEDAGCR